MLPILKILSGIVVICLVSFILHIRKRKQHPPGPLGFPFVGLLPYNIIQILFANYLPKSSILEFFRQLKKKYGDYWSIEMGRQRIVSLASMDIVTEAFVNNGNLFSGRPITDTLRYLEQCNGILFSNDEIWKENRRMAIKAMREFGMGKQELENRVCEEANDLITYLSNISSAPINTSTAFIKAISNVISKLVFNESNNYDDPDFEFYIKDIRNAAGSKVINHEIALFPTFSGTKLGRFLFSEVDKFFNSWTGLQNFIKKKCAKKIKSFSETSTPDCVMDYFLRYRYQNDANTKENEKIDEMSSTMIDLFIAGSETSNVFMKFSCLMLGKYQDVQNDIRNEVKGLTEDYRQINMNMRKECPKLLSFIDEIFRYFTIEYQTPRSVIKPCIFRGYQLYTEDIIVADWATITRDPELFPNPDVFDAYRYMDESKTKHISNKNLNPFGMGKRICIGESITHMEVFLFLSRILYHFQIVFPEETLKNFHEIMEGDIGFIHTPLDYNLVLKVVNPS